MAEEKKLGDVTVNDGKGLLDNEGLIDSLIMDCNNAIKQIVCGNYLAWCNITVEIVRKLGNLKKGMLDDLRSRDERIMELKCQLDEKLKKIDELTKKAVK